MLLKFWTKLWKSKINLAPATKFTYRIIISITRPLSEDLFLLLWNSLYLSWSFSNFKRWFWKKIIRLQVTKTLWMWTPTAWMSRSQNMLIYHVLVKESMGNGPMYLEVFLWRISQGMLTYSIKREILIGIYRQIRGSKSKEFQQSNVLNQNLETLSVSKNFLKTG